MLGRTCLTIFHKANTWKLPCQRNLLTVKESVDLQSDDWYRISKLWLEKMLDKKDMTPKDIDEQIKYLLPSALLFKDARPILSPPGCVINDWKEMFDKNGDVRSHAYFTNAPRYNDILYETLRRLYAVGELTNCIEDLHQTYPQLYHGLDVYSIPDDDKNDSNIETTNVEELNYYNEPKSLDVRWVTKDEFRKITGDKKISKYQYKFFMKLIEKLYQNAKSHLFMDFISKFMVILEYTDITLQSLQKKEDGSVRSAGYRKTAIADVILKEGTGIITVNGVTFDDYFAYDIDKLQVYMPFDAIGKRGEFDVVANVIKSGPASQAGAMRLAISRALAAISPDYQNILSQAGLLYKDVRFIERKKFGKHKARKSYRFVKR